MQCYTVNGRFAFFESPLRVESPLRGLGTTYDVHLKKVKGKAEHLYSALHDIQTTLKRSGMDHTVLPAINTMAALPRKRSPWRLHRLRWRTSNCSSLLIYRPQKDERLSRPSWLIFRGRFTHIVVTRPLKVERRTGSVRRPKTGVPPTMLRNQS